MDKSKYVERVTANVKTIIKHDVNSGFDRTPADYLDMALENLKLCYKMEHRMGLYTTWSMNSSKKLCEIWVEMQPEVLTAIEKYLQDFKHKKLTKDIKATSARVVIRNAMQDEGLKHHFTGQTHRAKVSVLLTPNKAATFYISYKKLNEQLPQVIDSIKIIREELQHLGNNFSINKVYNPKEFI